MFLKQNKINILNRILFVAIVSIFLASCEDEINWQSDAVFTDLLIVDCHLMNDTERQQVLLSRSIHNNSDSARPVSHASVVLDDGTTSYPFVENDTIPGMYEYYGLYPVVNRLYTLRIETEGKQYEATTEMLPVIPLSGMQYHLCEDRDSLFEIDPDFTHVDSAGQDAMWKILIDYSNTAADTLTPEKQMLLYTLYSVDIPQILHPEKETICFPPGTKITRKKLSITPEYARFVRSLLNETEWRGGNFDIIPANVLTNIQGEDVRGFFSASAVISDTLRVQIIEE